MATRKTPGKTGALEKENLPVEKLVSTVVLNKANEKQPEVVQLEEGTYATSESELRSFGVFSDCIGVLEFPNPSRILP